MDLLQRALTRRKKRAKRQRLDIGDVSAFTDADGKLKLDELSKTAIISAIFVFGRPTKSELARATTDRLQIFITRTKRQREYKKVITALFRSVRDDFFDKIGAFVISNFRAHSNDPKFHRAVASGKVSKLATWYHRFMDRDQLLRLLAPFSESLDLERILDGEQHEGVEIQERRVHKALKTWPAVLCSRIALHVYLNSIQLEEGAQPLTEWGKVEVVFDDIRAWSTGTLKWEDIPVFNDLELEGAACSEVRPKES